MGFWSTFIVVIVVLIVLLWITHYLYKNNKLPDGAFRDSYENMVLSASNTYDNYFTSPLTLYNRTVGEENDDTVQIALKKAMKKDAMYSKNEKSGKMSKKSAKDAAMNSFVIASLLRHNVAPHSEGSEKIKTQKNAAVYYTKAVNIINSNPSVFTQFFGMSGDKPKPNDNAVPPEFIIDRAEDFYDDYVKNLRNLGINPTHLEGHGMVHVPDFDALRENVREARVTNATNNGKPGKFVKSNNKDNALVTYYEERIIPVDPQNVHDSEINREMRNMLTRIVEKNSNDVITLGRANINNPNVSDIYNAILSHKFPSAAHKNRAIDVFNEMSQHNEVTALGSYEDEILLSVWQRVHSPENDGKRQALKDSFMDALADGFDINQQGQYKKVCVNGRCSRLLSSLTILDEDKDISKPLKTKEIMRNEVLSKSYKILQDSLAQASPDVAAAYRGETDTAGNAELENKVKDFTIQVKNSIETTMRKDYSESEPRIVEELIKDAQAGVDV